MWLLLGLLVKENFQFPCFRWTLKVCIVWIVLMSSTSLACYGGGGDGPNDDYEQEIFLNDTRNTTIIADVDEALVVNLTGIKDPVTRNIKSAWLGWEPSEETQKEWNKWHDEWLIENAKNGEVPWKTKQGKGWVGGSDGHGGPGEPGGQDFSAERGPGSRWPNLPGWADLGAGSDGAPVPPWAYAPKNVGKPSICYLPPIKGTCKDEDSAKNPVQRWGYNPYMDECQEYAYSGCGGTRNKFVTKVNCEKHCARPPPPSCSSDSGILDKSSKPYD